MPKPTPGSRAKDSPTNPLDALGEALGARNLSLIIDAIGSNPEQATRMIIKLLAVGPTPRFKKPDVPYCITLANATANGVAVAFGANIYRSDKYTLTVMKNGGPMIMNPPVTIGGTPISNTLIDIPIAGSADYVIAGSFFATNGVGDYLLRIEANNFMPTIGYGAAATEITVANSCG